jgi:hypothetical protein
LPEVLYGWRLGRVGWELQGAGLQNGQVPQLRKGTDAMKRSNDMNTHQIFTGLLATLFIIIVGVLLMSCGTRSSSLDVVLLALEQKAQENIAGTPTPSPINISLACKQNPIRVLYCKQSQNYFVVCKIPNSNGKIGIVLTDGVSVISETTSKFPLQTVFASLESLGCK